MKRHESVLLHEAVSGLNVKKGEWYLDATLGGGGHTKAILELGGKVFGIDVDPEAIKSIAQELSLKIRQRDEGMMVEGDEIKLAQGNFNKLKEFANTFGVWETSGVLFDLGWSSDQLETKGLSFMKDSPLDMRLSPDLGVSASDLINALSIGELYELFSKYGEESNSRRIARAIVESRVKERILTTRQLVQVVERVVTRREKIHPATRVFQALRIVVNNELENLEHGLSQAESLVREGGRVVVISFHSLEDRIVKNFFNQSRNLKVITDKPIAPSHEEVSRNPRARSAKMRIAEKI